ncbi:MAG: beta-lactamase family protein [Lewinella sp.]|nr:beta-lactamase family protein [Lewinella sp.]
MRTPILLFFTLITFMACQQMPGTSDPQVDQLAIENGLIPPITVKGQPVKKMNILDRMAYHKVPGVSIAVVNNGTLQWAEGYGQANMAAGTDVDVNTLFQAGSISKPVAALAVMKLMQEGRVDLDEDVNTYLKDWKIPDNPYTDKKKVTLRLLLTHSAGMTVHGFPGYTQKDSFPSIISVLNGKGNTPPIFVDTLPDSIWRYSGGGYTVMEKAVEDVSGMQLEEYMAGILPDFGMENSTYKQPLPESLHDQASAAYDNQGEIIEGLWHNYPEQAAAGLWTTPTDLAHYCMTVQQILAGEKDSPLSKAIIERMLTKHRNEWGLGPSLRGEGKDLLFQHGGKNAGFTNEMVAFAHRGQAVIVMTNGDNGGRLMGDIIRGVAEYYGWDIRKPREVEIVNVSTDKLENFTGKFKLDFQVPDIGDYFIDISLKDGQLFVLDPNNGDTNLLFPLGDDKFIDLELGDETQFEVSENRDTVGLLWNGQYQFYKVLE